MTKKVRVKELATGEVVEVPEALVKAWPGSYVPAPKESPVQAAETVSAAAGTQKKGKSA